MTPMRQPRRRTALSQRDIARAALELIDADGLAAFSMRKLGARLGTDPMTIYRRFEDQEDLFDEVAVEMFRGVPVEDLPWDAAWPDLLDAYGSALHDALLRHPNALPLYGTRSEEHTSELQSRGHLVCRLLLENKTSHSYALH